jgi:hypothetical protein
MSHKTHRLTLGKHSEEVTKDELEVLKKAYGSRFAEYSVEELHVAKPADVATPTKPEKAEKTPKDAPAAA